MELFVYFILTSINKRSYDINQKYIQNEDWPSLLTFLVVFLLFFLLFLILFFNIILPDKVHGSRLVFLFNLLSLLILMLLFLFNVDSSSILLCFFKLLCC